MARKRLIERERKRFDRFCEENGVNKTRRGSWIVYKGTHKGVSPSYGKSELDYNNRSSYSPMCAVIPSTYGPFSKAHMAVDRFGGQCSLISVSCDVGIHFCFTPEAAQDWGPSVLRMAVPQTAIVLIPWWVEESLHDISSMSIKARASHVRVLGEVKLD